MKQVITSKLPKQLAVPISLASMLSDSLRARKAIQTNMSGYPRGTHLIGRLQSRFRFSSIKELLQSIKDIRDVASLSAEILDKALGAKLEKYTFNRLEIDALISRNAPLLGYSKMSPEDKDLVAALVVETESHESSWMLQCDSSETNFHVIMNRLYSSVGSAQSSTVALNVKGQKLEITAPELPTYDPELESIVALASTRRVQSIAAEAMETHGNEELAARRLLAISTTHGFALMRVLDHVYSFMLDTKVWDNFISVRLEVNASTNKERVQTLKNFASYLHSLLMYPHFFSVEAFKETYSQLESFLLHFPPVPAHILQTYEETVSAKDILNAKGDVQQIYAACHDSNESTLDSSVIGFPTEFLDTFGLNNLISVAEKEAASMQLPLQISDLSLLRDPKLNSLLLSHPITTFNMINDIQTTLMIGNLVSAEIHAAVFAITPGITRYFSEDRITRLKNSGFKVKFGIAYPATLSINPEKCSEDVLSGNTLTFNPVLHTRSTALDLDLQRKQVFIIKRGSSFVKDFKNPKMITNLDVVRDLKRQIGYEWKTLLPVQLAKGTNIYLRQSLLRDRETQRMIIENISGSSFEFISRTMNNPHLREIWATFLSGFGLLYTFNTPEEVPFMTTKDKNVDAEALSVFHRHGYGLPYGTNYANLASLQGPARASDFFAISDTIFIRVLKYIPTPTDKFSVAKDFYLGKPYYYYASNSATFEVTSFTMGEGLVNFGLIPQLGEGDVPAIALDKYYAYMNDTVYMNVDYIFSPSLDTKCSQNISVNEQNWIHDKFNAFLAYRFFGHYSEMSSGAAPTVDSQEKESQLNKMVTEMENETKKVIEDSPLSDTAKKREDPLKEVKLDLPKKDVKEDGSRKSNNETKKEEKKPEMEKPESEEEDKKKGKKKKKDDDDSEDFDNAMNG